MLSIWTKFLIVGVAGGIGAVCRFGIEELVNAKGIWMGMNTWVVNTIGCLLIGIFAGWLVSCNWGDEAKTAFSLLTMTGFCGGFSTFAHFTLDCVKYFEAGHVGTWIVFALATIFIGLFCCALGYWIGQKI